MKYLVDGGDDASQGTGSVVKLDSFKSDRVLEWMKKEKEKEKERESLIRIRTRTRTRRMASTVLTSIDGLTRWLPCHRAYLLTNPAAFKAQDFYNKLVKRCIALHRSHKLHPTPITFQDLKEGKHDFYSEFSETIDDAMARKVGFSYSVLVCTTPTPGPGQPLGHDDAAPTAVITLSYPAQEGKVGVEIFNLDQAQYQAGKLLGKFIPSTFEMTSDDSESSLWTVKTSGFLNIMPLADIAQKMIPPIAMFGPEESGPLLKFLWCCWQMFSVAKTGRASALGEAVRAFDSDTMLAMLQTFVNQIVHNDSDDILFPDTPTSE